MGNTTASKTYNASTMGPTKNSAYTSGPTCSNDTVCKNFDSQRSTPNKLVMVCPHAKCSGGKCVCGSGCVLDPYTGICCSRIETDSRGNTFCIEEPHKDSNPSNPPNSCNIPNQKINGVVITGKKICDIYKKYNK